MTVDFNFNFWTLLMFGMNFGVLLWVQSSNRNKVAADELKGMQKSLSSDTKLLEERVMHRLGQHSERLSRMESKIEESIDHADIAAVHHRVDEVLAVVSKVEGRMHGFQDLLHTIHQTMIGGKA